MLLVLRYSLLSLLLLGLGLSGLPAQAPDKPEVKKTRLTKSQGVFLETEGKIRRVLVETVVTPQAQITEKQVALAHLLMVP